MKNAVYTHILKNLINHERLFYCEVEGDMWITDGCIAFCFGPEEMIFDKEHILNSPGFVCLRQYPSLIDKNNLQSTGNFRLVGDNMVRELKSGNGRTVYVNDKYIKRFFPVKRGEYKLYQSRDLDPIFAVNADGMCDGLIMPMKIG